MDAPPLDSGAHCCCQQEEEIRFDRLIHPNARYRSQTLSADELQRRSAVPEFRSEFSRSEANLVSMQKRPHGRDHIFSGSMQVGLKTGVCADPHRLNWDGTGTLHADPHPPFLPPCLTIDLGRTKTITAGDRAHVVLIGRLLTPQSIDLLLKNRCKRAGLIPKMFSTHGLRSGYLTEATGRLD